MSIRWSFENKNACYRVTQAGNAIRLYRNNVLHSQWNPNNPVSGKLWDLFLISALGTKKNLSRVLVLGVGGGSVINLIHCYYPDAEIEAVDFDKIHLKVARKYFKVNTKKCELVYADAEEWLRKYRGKKYDLIIDDVFNEIDNIPYRSIEGKKNWAKMLLKNLKHKGILVFNFADKKEWNKSLKLWKLSLAGKNIGIATQHKCDNRIVHISAEDISRKRITHVFQQHNYSKYIKYLNNGTISYRSIKSTMI